MFNLLTAPERHLQGEPDDALEEARACLAENDNVATFWRWTFTNITTGEPLVGRVWNTRYGRKFRVELPGGRIVWAVIDAARESTYTRNGYMVGREEFTAPAIVELADGEVGIITADRDLHFDGVVGAGDLRGLAR